MDAKRFIAIKKAEEATRKQKEEDIKKEEFENVKEQVLKKYKQIYKMLDDILRENNIGKDAIFECLELDSFLSYRDDGKIDIKPINNDEFDDRDEEDKEKIILSDDSVFITTGLLDNGKSGSINIEKDSDSYISLEDGLNGNYYDFGWLNLDDSDDQLNDVAFYNNVVRDEDDILKSILGYAFENAQSYIGRESYKRLLNVHLRATRLLERKRTEQIDTAQEELKTRTDITNSLPNGVTQGD